MLVAAIAGGAMGAMMRLSWQEVYFAGLIGLVSYMIASDDKVGIGVIRCIGFFLMVTGLNASPKSHLHFAAIVCGFLITIASDSIHEWRKWRKLKLEIS
jgi:hypothetical protein